MSKNESAGFRERLFLGLLGKCFCFEKNNWDYIRYQFNLHAKSRWWLQDQFYHVMAKFGFYHRHFDNAVASDWIGFILNHIEEFEQFYADLADTQSQETLIEVLQFRALGHHHVKLPTQNSNYAQCSEQIEKCIKTRNTVNLPYSLNCYDLPGQEGPVHVHGDSVTLRNTFFLEQYVYRSKQVCIGVQKDDFVIDGGGCWGDTALYFADKAGANGRVYSFEFDPQNLHTFQMNMTQNENLAKRIELIPYALWSSSGAEISSTSQKGAMTSLSPGVASDKSVTTKSIDDLIKEKQTKVNFIKLDIEGVELQALQGAQWVIRTFQPTLAVCLYHNMQDFIEIPQYLKSINPDYAFHLGHVTAYQEETVLFASAKDNQKLLTSN